MLSPDPTLTVCSTSSSTPLELGKPPPEVVTWTVRLFPLLNEAGGAELLVSKAPIPSVTNAETDFLAAFSYYPDGGIFIEAYQDSHPVIISIPTSANRTTRIKLRNSTVAGSCSEHFHYPLLQDCVVEIEGVTPPSGQLHFIYNMQKPSRFRAPPAAAPPMPNPPPIQLMHSLPHHESSSQYPANNNADSNDVSVGGGSSGSGGELAAAVGTIEPILGTANDENSERKVLETPAVQSRYVNPFSSVARHRQQQPSPSSGRVIQVSKSGIVIGGAPENIDDFADDDDSGDDGAAADTTPMMDIGRSSTPGGKVKGTRTVASPPPSTTPPPDPTEPPLLKCASPKAVVRDVENLDVPHARHMDVSEFPENPGDNSAPVTPAQKVEEGRKRKAPVEKPTASTKRRRGKDVSVEEDDDGDVDQEPPQTPKSISGGKGRVPCTETEDKAPKEASREGSRKPAAEATPPPSKNQTAPGGRREGTQFDTQYTLPDSGSDADSESEGGAHAPKKRKARGKTLASKTTTATTVRAAASSSSAKLSARKNATARPSGAPEPAKGRKPLRTQDAYEGTPPRISFTGSGLAENKSVKAFIRHNHSKTVASPTDPSCNLLVHGPGELKRTSKLIIAVSRGIRIVEEQWLLDSQAVGYWVDPGPYVPHPPREWEIDLAEAIERGRRGQTNVLKGRTIFLTRSLLAHLRQQQSEGPMMDMLKAAGAEVVNKKAPWGEPIDDALVLGRDEGDSDLGILEASGWKVYAMALVGLSVLRGTLQQGDELLARPGEKELGEKKRGGRKTLT